MKFLLIFIFIGQSLSAKPIVIKSDYRNLIKETNIFQVPPGTKKVLTLKELFQSIAEKNLTLFQSRESFKGAEETRKQDKRSRLPVARINSSQYFQESNTARGNPAPSYSLIENRPQGLLPRNDSKSYSRNYALGLEINGEPLTGFTYDLQTPLWTRTLDGRPDPSDKTEFDANFAIKLLRGSMFYNYDLSRKNAAFDFRVAKEDLKNASLQAMSSSQTYFYDVILKYMKLAIQRRALEAAQSLQNDVKELIKTGESDKIAGLKVDLQVTQAETDILSLEIDYETARENLRQAMNISPEEAAEVFPDLKEVMRDPQIPNLDLKANLEESLQMRPDVVSAKINLEKLELIEKTARMNTYPSLDMKFGFSQYGVDQGPGQTLDVTGKNPTQVATVGLQFSYILYNNIDNSTATQARIALTKSHYVLDDLLLKTQREISTLLSKIKIGGRKLNTSKQARALADSQLEAEYEKFSVGESTLKDLIDLQQQVINARLNEIQARVDLITAVGQLKIARGEMF